MSIEITVKAPELSSALLALAAALTGQKSSAQMPAGPAKPVLSAAVNPNVPPANTPPAAVQMPVSPPVFASVVPLATQRPMQQASNQTAPPVSTPPAPPVARAPVYDADALRSAGADLVTAGRQPELLNLLAQFQVQSVNQLPPEQYGAFATALRGLGAQI